MKEIINLYNNIIIFLYNRLSKTKKRANTPGRLFMFKDGKFQTIYIFKNKKDRQKKLIELCNKKELDYVFTILNNEYKFFKIDLKEYKANHKYLFNN